MMVFGILLRIVIILNWWCWNLKCLNTVRGTKTSQDGHRDSLAHCRGAGQKAQTKARKYTGSTCMTTQLIFDDDEKPLSII
jgi:hypothetical protein